MAGTVDRLCPGRGIAHVTHGQVIEVLVANRLTAPAPLWRLGRWARGWAVEEVFGIERSCSMTTVWGGPWMPSPHT
ncbi:hypothetical protein [Streptomyces sp. NPDC058579]|uniref:hypothetical protein n=1 Tax=Streptomyces sp. NPDC058579 TaxID=3346548 RepID=UPI0036671243